MTSTSVPEAPPEPEYRRKTWRDFLPRFDPRDWPMWIVVVICAAVYVWQITQENLGIQFAFFPAYLEGRWYTFLTSVFMHANWLHIGSNMYTYLSIAPWVIARFGGGMRAVLPFHLFYLLCGVAGNLAFYFFHPQGDIPTLGASGAIYGVVAAMMRLDPSQNALFPIFSQQTLKSVWFFMWSNALVIAIFGGPQVIGQVLSGQPLQLPIAWEAHLGGFIAGFFLIQLMAGRGWPQRLDRERAA